jgi:hypothetical protein
MIRACNTEVELAQGMVTVEFSELERRRLQKAIDGFLLKRRPPGAKTAEEFLALVDRDEKGRFC